MARRGHYLFQIVAVSADSCALRQVGHFEPLAGVRNLCAIDAKMEKSRSM